MYFLAVLSWPTVENRFPPFLLVVPLVHRFSVPVFFRLFPTPCSWHVDRLEPNCNMLQKHTVNGNKKRSPEGDLHANELVSHRLSVQRLFLRREECNTGNGQQHNHGNVRQHGSTGLSSVISIRIGVHGRRVIICKRGRRQDEHRHQRHSDCLVDSSTLNRVKSTSPIASTINGNAS